MDTYESRLSDAFWDLRDDACDHPGRWREVSAETIFQRLAELVEEAEDGDAPINWDSVTARLIRWRADQS